MTESTVVYATSNGTATAEPVEEVKQINLHVSPDRMDLIKVGLWRRIESNSISAMADLVGMFLWNGHSYLTTEEALIAVDDMTTAEIKAASEELTKLMKNTVASPQ